MDIEEAIHTHLVANSALVAVIGTRVYPGGLPEGVTLPAVTYKRISTDPVQHRSSQKPRYSRARFQIDGWGDTRTQAIQLRYLLRSAMGDFVKSSNPRVDVALLRDDRDVDEPESRRYRASLDYMVSHKEP